MRNTGILDRTLCVQKVLIFREHFTIPFDSHNKLEKFGSFFRGTDRSRRAGK